MAPVNRGSKRNRAVVRTSHVLFDETLLTFYLYSGNSLYAFSITPELSLEHLYFGPKLPVGYDLRFVSANTRSMVFNTLEGSGIYNLQGTDVSLSGSLDDTEVHQKAIKIASDASTENLLRSLGQSGPRTLQLSLDEVPAPRLHVAQIAEFVPRLGDPC